MAEGSDVTALEITATMRAPVEWGAPVALDSLLAAVVARQFNAPPPRSWDDVSQIEIPITREPGGRFHLASVAHVGEKLFSRLEYVHKRAPITEYAVLCTDAVKRVDLSAGVDKGCRIPRTGERYDVLRWWCDGDTDKIRDLLLAVTAVGARRRHGVGRVLRWDVSECEPWPGFPVVRDGQPLRPLPLDWPGLSPSAPQQFCNITYPYFLRGREEMLACPI